MSRALIFSAGKIAETTGIVDAGSGFDIAAAGTLTFGPSTATAIAIADTGVTTTVEGPLNVDEAVTFDTTLGVTGISTFTAVVYTNGGVDRSTAAALAIGATNATAINLGNAVGNPTLSQLGSGQVSFAGNVDATSGLDVTGAALTTTGSLEVNGTGNAFLKFTNGITAAVSAAGTGRIRYNDTTKTIQVSADTGAWASLLTTSAISLQSAYDGGASITTAASTAITFTLTSGDFNVTGAGGITFTPTSNIALNPTGNITCAPGGLISFTVGAGDNITFAGSTTSTISFNTGTMASTITAGSWSVTSAGAGITAGIVVSGAVNIESSGGASSAAFGCSGAGSDTTVRAGTGGSVATMVGGANKIVSTATENTTYQDLDPDTDDTRALGSATLRYESVHVGLASFNVWGTSGDANPVAKLNAALSFGAGGATAVDVVLDRSAADTLRLASGDSFVSGGGAAAFNWSSATGAFSTSTGAVSLNGDVTVAAGKDIIMAAGAGDVNFGSATGTYSAPTGVNTFGGSANNFTAKVAANGGLGRSSAGALAIGTDANSTSVNISKVGELTTVLGDFQVNGAETVIGATTFSAGVIFEGDVDLGNATTDTISFVGRVDTGIVPSSNNAVDLGDDTTPLRWRSVFAQTSLVANDGSTSVTVDPDSVIGTGAVTITAAAASTWSTSAGLLTINGTGGIELQGGGTAALAVNATGTAITVQAGAVLDTTSTGNINLPNNASAKFQVEGVAVGATVTAANLDTLTDGSNADALHSHSVAAVTQVVLALTAGEAVAIGAPVAIINDAGDPRVVNADADSGTDARRNVIGYAKTASAADEDPIDVIVAGDAAGVVFDSAPAAADVGKRVYLDPAAGTVSLTAPSGSGETSLKVGILLDDATTTVKVEIGERIEIA